MPKKIIERFMPKPETLQNHKHLQMFGKLLHKPNLWALNRRSAPMAFAVKVGDIAAVTEASTRSIVRSSVINESHPVRAPPVKV